MIRTIFVAAATMALLAAGHAGAAQKRDGTTAEEKANTARLNAEQLAKARAETDAYDARVAANAQQEAAEKSTFLEATAVYEAEKARVAAMSAEERIKWEADVAACKAGDSSRCAHPQPQPK